MKLRQLPRNTFLLAMLCVTGMAHGAETVDIVRDGKPVIEVVCLDGLAPSEEYAANELVNYIRKLSGATVSVVRAKDPGQLPKGGQPGRLFLGNKTCRAFCEDVSLDGLGDEGFVIRSRGKDLVIAGGELRGTLYGVYTFLEDYCGIRWWSPFDTDIPESPDIRIGEVSRRDVPRLEMRDSMCATGPNVFQWNSRNKVNGMSFQPFEEKMGGSYYNKLAGKFGHNQHQLVQEGGGEWVPEMRALTASGQRDPLQPCSTHPKVIEATTRAVLEIYRKNPQTPFAVIAHEDCPVAEVSWNHCRCERCAAIDRAEESHGGQFLHLVNIVAAELEKEFPTGRIMIDAYQWNWKPCKTMRPRPNVMVRMAPIQMNQFYPLANSKDPKNQEIERSFVEWGSQCSNLFIWTYVTNFLHYNAPWPNLDSMLSNIDFYVKNNAKGIMNQGAHTTSGGEFHALRAWTLAKKLWNPDLDNGELYRTFINGYYGPAAGVVQEYIDRLHAEVRNKPYPAALQAPLNQDYLSPSLVADLEGIARKAEAAVAGNEKYAGRVRHFRMPVWYILLMRGPASSTWREVESRHGKLDLARMSAEFRKVAADWGMRANNEGDRGTAREFLEWLEAYPGLVEKNGGPILAPEAKANPSVVFYLQPWQMGDGFTKPKNRVKDPQAVGGFALKSRSVAWSVRQLVGSYDLQPGAHYRLHLRVRAAEGPAPFSLGGMGLKRMNVKAENVGEEYRVFSSDPFTFDPTQAFWMALDSGHAEGRSVQIDSFWVTSETR